MSDFHPYVTPSECSAKRRKLEETTTPATECDSSYYSYDDDDDDDESWATGESDLHHDDGEGPENPLQRLTEDTLGTIFFGGYLNSFEVVKSASCVSKEMVELAKTQVKMLDLRKCPYLTNSKLQIVARRFPHLSVSIAIDFLQRSAVTKADFTHIFLLCIQELDLSYSLQISNVYHFRHLRLLKILKLRGTSVSDVGIESWLRHPSAGCLEELDLSAVAVGQSLLITDRTANLLAVSRIRKMVCDWTGLLTGLDRTYPLTWIRRRSLRPNSSLTVVTFSIVRITAPISNP
jgi:hypothetical protein